MGTGQHLFLKYQPIDEENYVSRPYTPVTGNETKNYMDLVIKVYADGKKGPGKMGNYLKNLAIGKTIDIRGPAGKLIYKGNGLFSIKDKSTNKFIDRKYKRVGMD